MVMAGTVRLHCHRRQQEGPPEVVGFDSGVFPVPLSWFWRLSLLCSTVFTCFLFASFAWVCIALCVCAALDAFIQFSHVSFGQVSHAVGAHHSVARVSE